MDFISALRFVMETWRAPLGLIAAEVLAVLLVASTADKLGLTGSGPLMVTLAIGLAVAVAWWLGYRLPKLEKGKVAIAIAIRASGETLQRKIKDDFVATFQQVLASSRSAEKFKFVEIPPHHARNCIDSEQAEKLTRGRYHFLLYGSVRQVNSPSGKRYVVDLEGQVRHLPVPEDKRRFLSEEFRTVLPRRVQFSEEGDLFAFEFTTHISHLVAKYVVALAMSLSGFIDEAQPVLEEALDLANRIVSNPPLPPVERIKRRAPEILEAMNLVRARAFCQEWTEDHRNTNSLKRAQEWLDKIDPDSPRPDVLTQRAICAFAISRDVQFAMNCLKRIPKAARDSLWNFNIGFLFAYEGNMKKASQCYRQAFAMPLPNDKYWELETFMQWIVELEPNKYQIYFILGQFNLDLKRDKISAEADYRRFLAARKSGEFDQEAKIAERRLTQMELLGTS